MRPQVGRFFDSWGFVTSQHVQRGNLMTFDQKQMEELETEIVPEMIETAKRNQALKEIASLINYQASPDCDLLPEECALKVFAIAQASFSGKCREIHG